MAFIGAVAVIELPGVGMWADTLENLVISLASSKVVEWFRLILGITDMAPDPWVLINWVIRRAAEASARKNILSHFIGSFTSTASDTA